MEYYKPPNRKGRPRSFLDKKEQISPRQMDMEISLRKKGFVENSYKGQIYFYIKQKSTPRSFIKGPWKYIKKYKNLITNQTCHRVGEGENTSS